MDSYGLSPKAKIKFRYSKRKIIYFWLVIMLTFFVFSLINFSEGQARDNNSKMYKIVIVKKGDTLWNIAKRYGPAHRDIREIVDDIKSANNIKDLIFPGDVLYVPVK